MTTQSSTGTVSTVLTSHFEHLQTLQESRVCSELLGTEDTLQTRVFQVQSEGIPDFITENVAWGAGPRAVQFLIIGGKARALLHGRTHVATEDIQALAKPVLRHRITVNFAAESDGMTSDDIIEQLIDVTPSKEDELTNDARFQKIFAS